jgi:hypothetical protein
MSLDTLAVVPVEECRSLASELMPFVVPQVDGSAGLADLEAASELPAGIRMVQVIDGAGAAGLIQALLSSDPGLVLCMRTPLTPGTSARLVELSHTGVKVFEVCADQHGRERLADGRPGRHLKDALREIHNRLVDEGIRDEVTLVVSGGIALAEHMAKAIICGADLVALDTPLLMALGCRVCRDKSHCRIPHACPCDIASIDEGYAAQRIVNLMGAWHSQLIEVLGAMGIREARRLRGEVGRAIFLEDVEKEAFGDLVRVSPERVRS